MSHPFHENSLSSTVGHAKHLISLHEQKKANTSKEVAEVLHEEPSELQVMQKIVNAIPEDVRQKKLPIVIGSEEKAKKGDWQKAVGPLTMLDFEPTYLHLIDANGNSVKAQRGYTYAIVKLGNNNEVNVVEIEIPPEGAMLPLTGMFSRDGKTTEDLKEIIETYRLAA